jgi:hypothetical protein
LLIAVALCAEPIAASRIRYNTRKQDYKCGRELVKRFVREQTDVGIEGNGCTPLNNKEVRCVFRFESYGDANFILDLKCKRGGWRLERGTIPEELQTP